MLILNIYFYISSFLSVLLSKALVHYCFLVFRCIGEYVSPDLFYFVNLTNSCSLIPQCLRVERTEQSHHIHYKCALWKVLTAYLLCEVLDGLFAGSQLIPRDGHSVAGSEEVLLLQLVTLLAYTDRQTPWDSHQPVGSSPGKWTTLAHHIARRQTDRQTKHSETDISLCSLAPQRVSGQHQPVILLADRQTDRQHPETVISLWGLGLQLVSRQHQFNFLLQLSFHFKSCGLQTMPYGFAPPN